MTTSFTLQENANERLDEIRLVLFPNSKPGEYRASYIASNLLENVNIINDIDDIVMQKEHDQGPRKSTTIRLRQAAYDKLKLISSTLGISDSEALRLVLLYSYQKLVTSQINAIPEQLPILRSQEDQENAEKALVQIKQLLSDLNERVMIIEKYLKRRP